MLDLNPKSSCVYGRAVTDPQPLGVQINARIDAALVAEPPAALRILYFGLGYAIIALGLFLLIFGLINITAVTLF